MPDVEMRKAFQRLPEVEAKLEAAEQLVEQLQVELRLALSHVNDQYILAGHYMRVMAKYLST